MGQKLSPKTILRKISIQCSQYRDGGRECDFCFNHIWGLRQEDKDKVIYSHKKGCPITQIRELLGIK